MWSFHCGLIGPMLLKFLRTCPRAERTPRLLPSQLGYPQVWELDVPLNPSSTVNRLNRHGEAMPVLHLSCPSVKWAHNSPGLTCRGCCAIHLPKLQPRGAGISEQAVAARRRYRVCELSRKRWVWVVWLVAPAFQDPPSLVCS